MGQDIRKMMKDYRPGNSKLAEGHEARFAAKLDSEGISRSSVGLYMWMRVAAVLAVLFAVGYFVYYTTDGTTADSAITTNENATSNTIAQTDITLGDISPDLKKIESYYMTGINVQLASLQVTDDNKELVDSYMLQLAELDKAYLILNQELNEVGPTEVTITALIDNLQLRLELLFKLKNKLKELKNQNNEDYNII